MTNVTVGYQGIPGSYSEEASILMLKQQGIHTYTLIPLISSQGVINELKKKTIDYGVMAIENSIGGIVQESAEAMKNEQLNFIESITLPIQHAAFKKSLQIENHQIRLVISHEQALKQCTNHIKQLFPNAQKREIEDTAIGAKYLAESQYDSYTAVICKQSAGLRYNLHLIHDSMQDTDDNRTTFCLFAL